MSPSFLKAYKYLCAFVFALIVLGGSVRAMNAGLACPDWPLCFGDFIPDYHPQVYFEFIHRALAGLVSIGIAVLNIPLIRHFRTHSLIKGLCFFSFGLLASQVVMGGLTVLKLLQASIVTLHLILGSSLFLCLLWILFLILKEASKENESSVEKVSRGSYYFSYVSFIVIFCQIFLGGLVASNYAAAACPDFPLCFGEWLPTFSGAIGLQVMHRLGAYITLLVVLSFASTVISAESSTVMRKWAKLSIVLISCQVVLGIANVLVVPSPPLIRVLHLALGVALLGASFRMVFWATAFRRSLNKV